jgi:hypothetical protein
MRRRVVVHEGLEGEISIVRAAGVLGGVVRWAGA